MTVLIDRGSHITGFALDRLCARAGVTVVHGDTLPDTAVQVAIFDLWQCTRDDHQRILRLCRQAPRLPVVVVSVDHHEAGRRLESIPGVYQWIPRTNLERIPLVLLRLQRRAALRRVFMVHKQALLSCGGAALRDTAPVITRSAAMAAALATAEVQLSWGDPVLLSGEPGSGRRTIALATHQRRRCSGQFVVADLAGLTAEQGLHHLRRCGGAGEEGTLYVPGVDELAEPVQHALLDLWQHPAQRGTGSLIFGTTTTAPHGPLLQYAGPSRIEVPPLRARPEDIPLLARFFLLEAGVPPGDVASVLTEKVIAVLLSMPFGGNVQHLRAVIHRMAIVRAHGVDTVLSGDDKWHRLFPGSVRT